MLTDRTVNTLIVRCDAFKVLNYEREASTLMTLGEQSPEATRPPVLLALPPLRPSNVKKLSQDRLGVIVHCCGSRSHDQAVSCGAASVD